MSQRLRQYQAFFQRFANFSLKFAGAHFVEAHFEAHFLLIWKTYGLLIIESDFALIKGDLQGMSWENLSVLQITLLD